jgi:hypothetical protein
VSTVLPALQAMLTGRNEPTLLVKKAWEKVDMAVLKVNTTGLLADTPVAPLVGLTDTIVGCAQSWLEQVSDRINKSPETRWTRRNKG